MPSSEKHLQQYRKNRETLASLQGIVPPPNDWIVTVAFYSAVHLMEKVLVDKLGRSSKSHANRNDLIASIDILKRNRTIRSNYTALEMNAWRSRYECVTFTDSETSVLIGFLDQLEQELIKLGLL